MDMPPGNASEPRPGPSGPPYPGPPSLGPPQHLPPSPSMDGFRIFDIILTVVFALGMVVVSIVALLVTLLAPMATDACHPDCGQGVDIAWAAMWFAMPVGFAVGVVGVVIAAVKRWTMFAWPLLGCVIIGGAAWIGIKFIESAAGM